MATVPVQELFTMTVINYDVRRKHEMECKIMHCTAILQVKTVHWPAATVLGALFRNMDIRYMCIPQNSSVDCMDKHKKDLLAV